MSETKALPLECMEYLQENGISKEKLPKDIVKKMNSLNAIHKRYEKNPTPKLKDAVTKIDIDIADLIADWIEKEYPEDYKDENPTSIDAYLKVGEEDGDKPIDTPPSEPKPVDTPPNPPKAVDTPPTQTKPVDTPPNPPKPVEDEASKKVAEMVSKIKENLNQQNRIKIDVLKSIIGKYPSIPIQMVGELKLKKVWMNDCFELIS